MEISNTVSEGKGLFYINEGNTNIAELQYELLNTDRLIIHHTFVSETLSGKGIGRQLVNKAVEYARQKKLKIVPVCSFAKKILSAENYHEVL